MTQAWPEPPWLGKGKSYDPRSTRAWTLAATFRKGCFLSLGLPGCGLDASDYRAIPVITWRSLPGNEANVEKAELSCWIWMEGLDPAEPEAGPLSALLTPVNKSSHPCIVFSFCLNLFEGHCPLQPKEF